MCGFGFGLQGCVDAELVYLLRATLAVGWHKFFYCWSQVLKSNQCFHGLPRLSHTHTHIHVRKHTKKLMKCTKTVNVIIPFDHWKLSKESILTLRKDV